MRAKTREERVRALHQAQRTLDRKLTNMKRLVTSIQLWQRRVKYYTDQIAITDEERQSQKEQKAARAAEKKRRAAPRRIVGVQ